MFETDVEFIRRPAAQMALCIEIYKNNTIEEACFTLRINPAAVGFVRSQDEKFDQDIRSAQGYSLERLIDQLPNIQDHIDDPIMAGVVSKNIQWLASKRRRDIYGEKLDVNHNHTVDIRGAIALAKQRTIDYIDHNPLDNQHSLTDNISVALVQDESDDPDPLS